MAGPKPPAHLRISMIGDLPDGEMFSCNISAKATLDALPDPDLLDVLAYDGDVGVDSPSDHALHACTDFWARNSTGISLHAVLKRVKVAAISAAGTYMGSPKEYAVNVAGGHGDGVAMFPHQMARKITFETDADLGRVKGGFYLPGPTTANFDQSTNLYSAESTAALRDSVATFLDELAYDNPIVPVPQLVPVVASAGRHNADGSVRLGPGLHTIKRVNVGRRIDVQRRRANKLSEARIADAGVDF